MESIEFITQENEHYKQSNSTLQSKVEEVDNELAHFKEKYYQLEKATSVKEFNYQKSIESATDLTERQNSLMVTLEGKVSYRKDFSGLCLTFPVGVMVPFDSWRV
jgi:hypothetical protein